jgi:hypothetical protein
MGVLKRFAAAAELRRQKNFTLDRYYVESNKLSAMKNYRGKNPHSPSAIAAQEETVLSLKRELKERFDETPTAG